MTKQFFGTEFKIQKEISKFLDSYGCSEQATDRNSTKIRHSSRNF